jgi:hypothetical protein
MQIAHLKLSQVRGEVKIAKGLGAGMWILDERAGK